MGLVLANQTSKVNTLLATLILGIAFAARAFAAESDFIKEFIKNHDEQKFKEQVTLVEANKTAIPDAVKTLVKEAKAEGRNFDEMMYFLNIASSLAYMHMHWNNDSKPLKELDPIIKAELKKEQQRLAELTKWDAEESMLGNFVMRRHEKEMEAQGLAPVIYPHWIHRVYFECKVCHESIFKMQRWVNDITKQKIDRGQQCGVCHNGTIAFDSKAKDNCNRCHLAGLSDSDHLHHPEKTEHSHIKQVMNQLGGEWNPENLPNGNLPLDRFRFINWMELKNNNVFKPIASLDKDYKEEIRDNLILFKSKSDYVENVLFDHKTHSDWIKCSTCHPAIFSDSLGGTDIKMTEFSKGNYCGRCHGHVSFSFSDCVRCHNKNPARAGAELLNRPSH